MSQTVIENPVINSPFAEPARQFRFSDEGITNEIIDGRRISSYFVPIAAPKKKSKQKGLFDTEWTQDRIEENKLVNKIRRRVALWRQSGWLGGDAHDFSADRVLDKSSPRKAALLLPDRSS